MEEKTNIKPKKRVFATVIIIFLLSVIGAALVTVSAMLILKPFRIELIQPDIVEVEKEKKVSVSGEGKIKITPDIATVTIGAYTIAETTEKSQDENSAKINKIVEALKNQNIKDEDLQTTNYQIGPEYDYSEGRSKVIGYRTDQNINVIIRDLQNVGRVLTKAAEAGANNIQGVGFTVENMEKFKKDALDLAYQNAQERAVALVTASGSELGEVISITESEVNIPGPFYAAMDKAELSGEAEIIPEIPSGQEEVSVKIDAVYKIK